jgi:hypothetical protein
LGGIFNVRFLMFRVATGTLEEPALALLKVSHLPPLNKKENKQLCHERLCLKILFYMFLQYAIYMFS